MRALFMPKDKHDVDTRRARAMENLSSFTGSQNNDDYDDDGMVENLHVILTIGRRE